MARTAREMADILINLYRSSEDKNKGRYRLSKDQFKTIAGKESLKSAYLFGGSSAPGVDTYLREDGFVLIDLREEKDQIAVLGMKTINKRFQELPESLIDENECLHEVEEDW